MCKDKYPCSSSSLAILYLMLALIVSLCIPLIIAFY